MHATARDLDLLPLADVAKRRKARLGSTAPGHR
jgi:hypothetical protein